MTFFTMINKSMQISKIIAGEIDQNMFTAGDRLPTEKDLAARFQVSRETVRKALKNLIETGKVHNIQGSGYYVRHTGLHMVSTLNKFLSITDLIRNANLTEADLEVQIFLPQSIVGRNFGELFEPGSLSVRLE
ncbi:GntR family transcriptional regulator [Paenibacillus xerothermodurans]|uniref:GntR family transcriptional regulator n=1 Tax=Paenibacillus xerothermodurans TaxID=1977292 RepID=A0A2W1NAD5_PAEXE|nr:GntR family transcriptional regulator [Paenibacillus xerothermodurans]PZE20640.1 GntR family transcriptional regulator [Paenibacillus xerothermodurans]